MKRITLVCGHYGSGKTNFALNLAVNAAKRGEKITLVDLDIVNPYFRTADYKDELEAAESMLLPRILRALHSTHPR